MPGAAFCELLERVAHPKPGRHGMAALHPAENPGDGAQILKFATFAAARGARSDARRVQLVDRSRLFEIFQHVRIVGDLLAVDAVRRLRHLLNGFFPTLGLVFSLSRQSLQTRRDHQFQIPFREHRVGIFPVENFALLSDANVAGKTSRRLRQDGRMRRSASAAHRSPAAMEQAKLHSIFPRRAMQLAMRFIKFPGAGEHASIFVGVGIAEHHFLPASPGIEQRLILGIAPESAHDRAGCAK